MPVDKELAKKHTPKTKDEFDAYVAAMDSISRLRRNPARKRSPAQRKQNDSPNREKAVRGISIFRESEVIQCQNRKRNRRRKSGT